MINKVALQDIQTNIGWLSVEELLAEYIKEIESQKPRVDDQFHLTWDLAYREGGVEHLKNFFKLLDNKARE